VILFKPEHVAPILAGRKTQTRRLVGKRRWKVGTVHLAKTGYRRDQTFARIRITTVRQERLGDITETDAIAEGYGSVAEYQPDRLVWVIDFEVVRSERAVKAITIHQPWASLIAHGYKRFETRSWTNYRGPIAIHAGLQSDFETVKMLALNYTRIWHQISPLPKGCIVAVAELVECWEIGRRIFADGGIVIRNSRGEEKVPDLNEFYFGDFTPGRFAWELLNVRWLREPIPARGRQGLWNWEPPDDWKCVVCEEFVVGGPGAGWRPAGAERMFPCPLYHK